jgi:hypothetical protein
MAHTDPAQGVDVSHHMDGEDGVELGITQLFFRIFKGKCCLPPLAC